MFSHGKYFTGTLFFVKAVKCSYHTGRIMTTKIPTGTFVSQISIAKCHPSSRSRIQVQCGMCLPRSNSEVRLPGGVCTTHWDRVTHVCVSELTIVGSDNGLSPGRRQAIIKTIAGVLLIVALWTNFSEISREIHAFSFMKMHLKM